VRFSVCLDTRRLRARCAIWASILTTRWPYRSRSKSKHTGGGCGAVAPPSRLYHVGFCGRYWGHSRHRAKSSKMSKVTLSDTSRTLITALRKVHSITSSATASRPGGNVRPSAFAVLRYDCRLFGHRRSQGALTWYSDYPINVPLPGVAQFGIFTCPLVKVITTLEDDASAIGGTFESVICGAAPGVPPRGTV
jgi:hypothetical protein